MLDIEGFAAIQTQSAKAKKTQKRPFSFGNDEHFRSDAAKEPWRTNGLDRFKCFGINDFPFASACLTFYPVMI